VLFPLGPDGRRSTASTGKAVWADAVRGVDDVLGARIGQARDWRKEYVRAVVSHTAAATRSPDAAVTVARQGLAALGSRMRFERDGAAGPVADAVRAGQQGLATRTVRGEGERVRELVVPYRGQRLSGDRLRRQADAWVAGGGAEPSFAAAVHALVDEPAMLDVSDRAFALLGAGAELGPLEPLMQWGGHVLAVDVPQPRVWERVLATARAGSGTLTAPESAGTLGVDLLTQTPEVAAFLRTGADGMPLTVGSYAYADGARTCRSCTPATRWSSCCSPSARTPATPSWRRRPTPSPCRRRSCRAAARGSGPAGGAAPCRPRSGRRPAAGCSPPRTAPRSSGAAAPARPDRRSASPTRWSRSRARTTRWPSGCSAGGPWRRRPTATWCRRTSRRPPRPARC
jgi:hypothetical protein